MNDYERKQQHRQERLLKRAQAAEAKADAHSAASHAAVEHIPLGQPILVGHHSEAGHRADLRRSHRHMERSCAARAQAERYREQAARVGHGGISADDPEALTKLRAKLAQLETRQAQMKAINGAWRRAGKPAPADDAGWTRVAEALALPVAQLRTLRDRFARFPYEQAPYPGYALQNNNANRKRVQHRIAELERAASATPQETEYAGFRVCERPDLNRVQIRFADKPEEAVRTQLKRLGFRWSRAQGAWQRPLNGAGRAAAECFVSRATQTDTP